MTNRFDSTVTIRRAVSSDARGIRVIGQRCLGMSWSEKTLAADLDNIGRSLYFVAVAFDQSVIGFVSCWYVLDEAEIIDLAVVSEYRRQGVAFGMMAALRAELQKLHVRLLRLEVRETNRIARLFYQRIGFDEMGYRSDYYPDTREVAVLMEQVLNEPDAGANTPSGR